MKLREVFRFEVEYRLRSGSTWAYAVLLVAVPFLMMQVMGGSQGYMNRPQIVAVGSVIVGMLGMLATAATSSSGASRSTSA